jgi:multicomponent Na+:H+ antiporter subunit D
MINNDWPILQVIIPLFGAIATALCFQITYARIIAIITAISSLIVSLYGMITLDGTRRYMLGNWQAPIGIEYRLDHMSQPAIVYIFVILLFILTICRKSIISEIEEYISPSRRHIIYTMILLVATGLSGMVATNDLFNLYVFLEIASLASYALISQCSDNRAARGALDYLILGTVGASLILIGIGMLYSHTGTLNIDDIHERLEHLYGSRIVILGFAFFITGCLLKIALFPLHFWMIRAYEFATSALLIYLASLSSIVGFYVLVRFIYFVADYRVLYDQLHFGAIIQCLSLVAIVVSSYLALKSDKIRSLIVYSIAAQVGYICLMLINPNPVAIGILASCLLADSLLKIGLFAAISDRHCERGQATQFTKLLLLFNIISSAGLPFTIGFVNKINILSLLFRDKEYLALFVVIASSILALEYHYKLWRLVKTNAINYSGIVALSITSFASLMLLIMNSEFTRFVVTFFTGVMNG